MKDVKHPFRCENCRWRSKDKEMKIDRQKNKQQYFYICNTRNAKRYLTDDIVRIIEWVGCFSCNRKDCVPGFTGLRIHCIHLRYPKDNNGKGIECAKGLATCPGVCNVGRLYSPCEEFEEHD